jgi:F0F1-type ATP synthase membrane subunit b/b'
VIYTPDEMQRLNAEFVRVLKNRNAEWKEYQRRRDEVHAEAQAKSAAEFAEYDRKRAERYAKRAMCNTPRNNERSRRSRID